MALRGGTYSRSYIPKGGGGKQLPMTIKPTKMTAPKLNTDGVQAPQQQPIQKLGKSYFNKGMCF